LIVFRDVSEEKEIDRIKSEFVSLAAHQLRTPIAGINWYTEMLISGSVGILTDEQKKIAEAVYSASRRMTGLIKFLLNTSRLELGTIMVEPAPVDICEIISDTLEDMAPGVQEKQLAIITDSIPDSCIIETDSKLFQIIIQNIISNAVKYTPSDGMISISAEQRRDEKAPGLSKNGEYILISIKDSGCGIPPEDQAKIFTKLFRAGNVGQIKRVDGFGLGLYMTKSIVEMIGGKIWFESKENRGTTFFISLPVRGLIRSSGTHHLE
jgi:signal transduction histidine kinase